MVLAFNLALSLAKMIRKKEISSRELTDYFINRIERFDDDLNAVVVRDFERAREAADAADAALARGEILGPLHGLPMTIKEFYDIAGLPTTRGNPDNKGFVATQDAVTVTKLKAAGAHFMGKTNLPLNLMDYQSFNDIYGTTNNPWDLRRTPGGSSGGSAAALSAGLTALEAGSDIGGSVRGPAHYCGVYGHKTSQGIVASGGRRLGTIVAPGTLGVLGPMARSAEDLAASVDIIAGPEPLDRRGWRIDLPRPTRHTLADYRVAIWTDDEHAPFSTETADRVQEIGDRLASLGAIVSDSARPEVDFGQVWRKYLTMLRARAAVGVFDEEFPELQKKAALFGSDDLSDAAVIARAAVQSHDQWSRLNNERELLRMAWRAFFDDWDILICPTMPTPAFEHDHTPTEASLAFWGRHTVTINGEEQPYFRQLFWVGIMNLSRLPSTVFPTGLSNEELPIGLQAVGAEYDDYICIDFARLIPKELGGFLQPNGYED